MSADARAKQGRARSDELTETQDTPVVPEVGPCEFVVDLRCWQRSRSCTSGVLELLGTLLVVVMMNRRLGLGVRHDGLLRCWRRG